MDVEMQFGDDIGLDLTLDVDNNDLPNHANTSREALKQIVARWGCRSVLDILEANEIDIDTLPLLNEDVIKNLIPKLGSQLKFLAGWQAEYQKTGNHPCKERASTSTSSPSFSFGDSSELSSITESEDSSFQSFEETTVYDSPASPRQSPSLKRFKRVDFNIAGVLGTTSVGRTTLKNINAAKFCNKRDRHTIVDLLTQYLFREYGSKPSSFVKAAMAQSIVTTFPFLRDAESPLGYEAWYCKGAKGRPATGYLEEHLRYVRKKEKATQVNVNKEKAQAPEQVDQQEAEPLDENITMMEEWLRSNREPEEKVHDYMRKTARTRHNWIKSSDCSVTNILATYPRLLDNGMIEKDFAELFPEKSEALYQKWPKFGHRVVEYAQKTAVSWRSIGLELEDIDPDILSQEEKTNLGFFVLPVLFRGRKESKRGMYTTAETLSSFVDVQPEVLNIKAYADAINAESRPQPFVVIRGHMLRPTQAYVIVDRNILPVPTLLKAIDVCFKALYVLDLEYQPHSFWIWKFLQTAVYQFPDGGQLPPKLREVRVFINQQ